MKTSGIFLCISFLTSGLTSGLDLLNRDILQILSRRPVAIATCRTTCLEQFSSKNSKCRHNCRSCWDSCKRFLALATRSSDASFDCDNRNRGCIAARDAVFGRDAKDKNRVQHRSRSRQSFNVKFPKSPKFNREACSLQWDSPTESSNALTARHRTSRSDDHNVVFIIFGKDHESRWYEIGQTSSTDFNFSPDSISKILELRLMVVGSNGVLDEVPVTPSTCETTDAPLKSSQSEHLTDRRPRNFRFPPDQYFLPLVLVCILLSVACLTVTGLIVKNCRTEQTQNTSQPSEDTFSSKRSSQTSCHTAVSHISGNSNNNNNNNNVSIEIFEDPDPALPNFTAVGISGEQKLKAHVCFSRCGLGPEYFQFVKNTKL